MPHRIVVVSQPWPAHSYPSAGRRNWTANMRAPGRGFLSNLDAIHRRSHNLVSRAAPLALTSQSERPGVGASCGDRSIDHPRHCIWYGRMLARDILASGTIVQMSSVKDFT